MPELPEVQTVVNTLGPRLVGRSIVRVVHVRPDVVDPPGTDFAALVTARRVVAVDRRAKRIVCTLDDASRFYVHLGMTGRLTLADPAAPMPPHAHWVARLCDGTELRFVDPRRFGGLFWLGTADPGANVGPEPFDLTPARLLVRLNATARAVKTALLDQRVVAGVGNIYADEALHAAGIYPHTRGRDLTADQAARLNGALKRVLRRAIRAGGSSIRDYVDAQGQSGSFQHRHRVYDRAGHPCRACRTLVVRVVLGGRSTHYCPACQIAAG